MGCMHKVESNFPREDFQSQISVQLHVYGQQQPLKLDPPSCFMNGYTLFGINSLSVYTETKIY
jgi:hypothetical protein